MLPTVSVEHARSFHWLPLSVGSGNRRDFTAYTQSTGYKRCQETLQTKCLHQTSRSSKHSGLTILRRAKKNFSQEWKFQTLKIQREIFPGEKMHSLMSPPACSFVLSSVNYWAPLGCQRKFKINLNIYYLHLFVAKRW